VQSALGKRFARFGLTLHPEKTRLVRHGRPGHGPSDPSPECFDFLGFTHFWGKSRTGTWTPMRKTSKSRFTRAKKAMNLWLAKVRHWPLVAQANALSAKLRGHFLYYGLRGNSRGITCFRYEVVRLWRKWLSRRSQRGFLTWDEFNAILRKHPLPVARLPSRATQLRLANL
jgi:hypothetical protein